MFLRQYLARPPLGDDLTVDYQAAYENLNGDPENEVIVYLDGMSLCGSGGCLTLVLRPDESSYQIVGKITLTRPPIRVLDTSTNGWRDISVWVQGGSAEPGYEAVLPFDGQKYPANPSATPAHRLRTIVPGRIVIQAEADGKLLYK